MKEFAEVSEFLSAEGHEQVNVSKIRFARLTNQIHALFYAVF